MGILGINSRNINYLFELNPRCMYKQADDKIVTKEMCKTQGIPVPQTYAVIKRFGDLQNLSGIIGQRKEFVVKPARGAGGCGVLVVLCKKGNSFETSKREKLSLDQIKYHVSTILSGLFSLGGNPDHAIVEKRIAPHPEFEHLAVGGTPDIRLILYKGIPVMSMLRLPTKASNGRANLHQGAIGVAVNMQTGQTFGGVYYNRIVGTHPDTGVNISGIIIPDWTNILGIAMKLSDVIKLDYIGVDVLLDAIKGPIVIEANARPGLSIQIANRCGLLPKFKYVDLQPARILSIKQRHKLIIEYGRSLDTKNELIHPAHTVHRHL